MKKAIRTALTAASTASGAASILWRRRQENALLARDLKTVFEI